MTYFIQYIFHENIDLTSIAELITNVVPEWDHKALIPWKNGYLLADAETPDFSSDDEAEMVALDNNSISGTRSLWLIQIMIDDTLV